MSSVSTHVLDTATGRPAANLEVRLAHADGPELTVRRTNDDGRVGDLAKELAPGAYRVTFLTGPYLAAQGHTTPFYPEASIVFVVEAGEAHYHIPLLLSPYGYSTYRGS